MNTIVSKINFTKSPINLSFWSLDAMETPYQNHCLSYCDGYLREPSLLLK